MKVIKLTKQNFSKEAEESSIPVLIDFWAPWCGPCRMFSPIIEELAEETDSAKICKVNIDEEPELAEKFSIASIPTILVMKNGKETKKHIGLTTKENLLAMLK